MESRLFKLTGRGSAEAAAFRGELADLALAERHGSFDTVADYVADLARRTVCLTLLAGSGSRWLKSLALASGPSDTEESRKIAGFDTTRPRGLFPVRDFLLGGERIPIAAYALAAVKGLGRQLIVVRGWEAQIDAEILAPLGIFPCHAKGKWGPCERRFFTQLAPFGKPLGHGDAAWQSSPLWAGADYVIANFGGDANSRRTIVSSLLALDALRAQGAALDLLMPAAPFESPAYPIGLDEEGLPRSFGHAKLQGGAAALVGSPGLGTREGGAGYTNVGVRVYSGPALLKKVEYFRSNFWEEGRGYVIPGNDPEGGEFALDNVDSAFAAEGRARILAIARPEELTPAKTLGEVPAFERAIEEVVSGDRGLLL